MILGMVAIAASTLFVSCAKKHEITPVPAFPRERAATYKFDTKKNAYTGSASSSDDWDSASKWTGFRIATVPEEIKKMGNVCIFMIAVNKDWTASVAEDSKEYLKFRVWNGKEPYYSEENWTLEDEVSGSRDNQAETQIVVIKTPEFGEKEFESHINLTMAGQTMTLAKITIGPKAEEE